ncbi:MAG: serine hydrolase [Coprococcus sp.]|nr:serine hydrolase [Coprococcus sp.]
MERLRKNGISPKAVDIFIREIKKYEVDMHSFAIYKGEEKVCGVYGYPFQEESMHRMYSSGKMLVALAVLKAVDEGRLSLEDYVLPYFEGKLPKEMDEKYSRLQIKHMLTMNTGHDYDTMEAMRADEDWVHGFFKQAPEYEPGGHFFYNNGVPYILTQVVKQAAGCDYLEYLDRKFFQKMDVHITADRTPQGDTDPSGISIRICDFEKLPLLLLNQGKWEQEQLIAEEWISRMGMYHTPSIQSEKIQNVNLDTKYGYGYFLWRNSVGGYRLDGGRGQFGLVFPDLDMTVSIMSAEEDQGLILELFWKHVYPYLWAKSAPKHTSIESLTEYRALPEWNERCADTSDVHGCSYMFPKNDLNIEKVTFTLEEERMRVYFVQEQKKTTVYAGLEGRACGNEEMIALPEPNYFMNHVSGNTDHCYYVTGRYITAPDFMGNKEATLFIRTLDKNMYDILSFRFANHAVRMEWAHGSWDCVQKRGRLEILPHIPTPVMVVGKAVS